MNDHERAVKAFLAKKSRENPLPKLVGVTKMNADAKRSKANRNRRLNGRMISGGNFKLDGAV